MVRRVYYKPAEVLVDTMVGVHVTADFKKTLDRGAVALNLTKSEFIRLVLEKGLKVIEDERSPQRRRS